MEKRESSYTAGGNVNWCSYCGKYYGGLFKKIIELSYDPEITFIGMHTHTHTHIYDENLSVHSSTIYNTQDIGATQLSINRWMD